jgi:hypothetical protein
LTESPFILAERVEFVTYASAVINKTIYGISVRFCNWVRGIGHSPIDATISIDKGRFLIARNIDYEHDVSSIKMN